jgi:hypothetical protein
MARMYHPELGREITVPDDEDTIAVHKDAGWEDAPEPEHRPGYEPEPVVYEPVTASKSPGDMTVDELREALERRGLPKSGNKDELIARLTGDDEATDETD